MKCLEGKPGAVYIYDITYSCGESCITEDTRNRQPQLSVNIRPKLATASAGRRRKKDEAFDQRPSSNTDTISPQHITHSLCSSAFMLHTEISQQLLNGLSWIFVETCMLPRGSTLLTLVIPWPALKPAKEWHFHQPQLHIVQHIVNMVNTIRF